MHAASILLVVVSASFSPFLTSLQCMEVSGNLLSTIGAAPGSSSAELGQRWLGQVDMMLDAPLEGGEDPCVSCIMEILRSERGLQVLKPMWPKVIIGLGARIASTNDVARAGAINALTQWIRSAHPRYIFFFMSLCVATKPLTLYCSRRHLLARARSAHPCARPADITAHRLRDEAASRAAPHHLQLIRPVGFQGLWHSRASGQTALCAPLLIFLSLTRSYSVAPTSRLGC